MIKTIVSDQVSYRHHENVELSQSIALASAARRRWVEPTGALNIHHGAAAKRGLHQPPEHVQTSSAL